MMLSILLGIPAVVFFFKAIRWNKGHYWQNLLMVVLTLTYGTLCFISAIFHWSINPGDMILKRNYLLDKAEPFL